MYLMDTDIVSELRKGDRADRAVRAWFDAVADEHLHLSAISIGEIRRGVELLRRRDPSAASALDRWMGRVTEAFESRILPVDATVADHWGRLGVPDRIPHSDGLIAATALVHDLTLVTRTVRDMARTGVRILDPFAAS